MEIFKMIGSFLLHFIRSLGKLWQELPNAQKLKYYRLEKQHRLEKNADSRIFRRDGSAKCRFKIKKMPHELRSIIKPIYPQKSKKRASNKRWKALKSKVLRRATRSNPTTAEEKATEQEFTANVGESPSKSKIVKLEPTE